MLNASSGYRIFRISGDKNGPYAAADSRQLEGQIAAIPVGQDYVSNQQLHLAGMITKGPHRVCRVSCRQHPVPRRAEDFVSHVTNKSFVFHQQDGWNSGIGWLRGRNAIGTCGGLVVWICQMQGSPPHWHCAFVLPRYGEAVYHSGG